MQQAAINVALRFLNGEPDMHADVEAEIPLLGRIVDLVQDQADRRSGQEDEDNVLPDVEQEWYHTGFTLGTVRFAATVGDIALRPDKARLREALRRPHLEEMLGRVAASVADIQYDEVRGYDLTREWSGNFPALAMIGATLMDTYPAYLDGRPLEEGFYDGVHVYPSVLSRLALVDEMPKL
ncbi:MAG: hypothetical protein JWM37_429 [Candidatus Saccharibacteria bacterium]|nr:hypothetical protein [Candidatus Saccharibacteria bacterium]